MSFELNVAVKRDPAETLAEKKDPPQGSSSLATVHLNGVLNDVSVRAVDDATSRLFEDGVKSVVIAIENVQLESESCTQKLESYIMAHRDAGRQVQATVRHVDLHGAMSQLPRSLHWLMVHAGADPTAARLAIHVDRG